MAAHSPAKVSIAHTTQKHRSIERVRELVQSALSNLGGVDRVFAAGPTGLITPHQTVYYSAEEGCAADPLVVGALIRIARGRGAAHVHVAESSGGFFSSIDCMRATG